jgi:hypothetical protein
VVVGHAVGGRPPDEGVAVFVVASQVDHQAHAVVGEGVKIGGSEQGPGETEEQAGSDVSAGYGQAADVMDH